MHTLSLLVGLAFLGTAEARKPKAVGATPSANAGEIPALAELLDRTGWTPTPELSGAFQAGHVFRATDLGHRLVTDTCVASTARESTYTETAMLTSLQAGVSVGLGNRGTISGGITKKVKFGTPTHHAIPELELSATDDCASSLRKLASLDGMYVVQEVLMATITEQTCGSLDASGRFVSGLANVDASVQQACAQASLEPVAVGYRTAPMTSLLGGAPPSPGVAAPVAQPAAPTPSAGTDCLQVQIDTENGVREQQRDKALAADHRALDQAYVELGAERCLDRDSESERRSCAFDLLGWIMKTDNLKTTVPGGTHKIPTDCGTIKVKLSKEKVRTDYDLSRAQATHDALKKPSPKALFEDALENFRSDDEGRMRTSVGQFVEACEGGEFLACQWAGNRYNFGDVVPKDLPRARTLYRLGCDNGRGAACWELGLLFEKGQGGPEDRVRAYQSFEAGCDDDHTSSCGRAANMLRNGDGTDADPARAMARLVPLCEADNRNACYYLALGSVEGTGVPEDPVKAHGYYSKACTMGSGNACNEAGVLLDKGSGALNVDHVAATRLYELGCEADSAMACSNLAYNYRVGEGVTKNRTEADRLLQKACDLGKEDDCK